MHIHVNPSATPTAELVEAEDFRAFDVIVDAADGDVTALLDDLGSVTDDGEHVFIEAGKVKALAGARATDPGWLASFEKMIAYAADHGWTDADGRIRAHIEAAA